MLGASRDGVASVGDEVAAASGPLLEWLKSAAEPQQAPRVQMKEQALMALVLQQTA